MQTRTLLSAAFLSLLMLSSAQAQTVSPTAVVSEGRALLNQQRAQEAFQVFKAQESEFAGNANFDYWFGVAAVRAGEPFEAALALERVIAREPRHAGARLELVAVYLQLNRENAAERQLDFLEGLNPPPRAREAMTRFREVIAQRRSGAEEQSRLIMISLDTGYDSNYLNYPDTFDLFAGTILEGIAVLEADDTMYNSLRGVYFKRYNTKTGAYLETSAMGQMRVNHNSEASIFDTTMLHAAATVGAPVNERTEIRFGAEIANLWLDNTRYRTQSGISLGTRQALSERSALHITGSYREFNHAESRNDFSSWSLDTTYLHSVNEKVRLRPQLVAEFETVSREPSRQGGDATKLRFSMNADWVLSAQHSFVGTLGYDRQEYDRAGFAIFNRGQAEVREDDSWRARLEWNWQPNRHWRASLFAQVREQTSSITFFDLDQTLVQGSISYVF